METLCWEPSKAAADLALPGVVMRLIQLLRDQNAEITVSIGCGRMGRHIAILPPSDRMSSPGEPWRGNYVPILWDLTVFTTKSAVALSIFSALSGTPR